MSLHLQYQAIAGGALTDVDLTTERVTNFVLKISDSHPMTLTFNVLQAQHTLPFGLRKFIKFWDDAGTTPDGAPQSNSNPLFEGWIWECQPSESNLLAYTAYDPSMISGREIIVMSEAWSTSTSPGTDAVPRLIFNATITNDVDYAFSRADGQTIASMLKTILDDAILPLGFYNAAPGSGSAYINAELAAFTYTPQEKIVFTNQSIRNALDSLTQSHYPEYAFLWTPGTRLWHWYSRYTAPPITLTLNDPDATNTVLTLELHRSLEGRYPAVKFYGPETSGPVEIFSTLDGSLTPIGPSTQIEMYIDSGGIGTVDVFGAYQIVDSTKRRGARLFPTTFLIRDDAYHWVGTRSPTLEFSFDNGDTWRACESVWFDWQNGIVSFPEGVFIYFWTDMELEPGSTRHYWTPNAYRLIWAPYNPPITVRYPASGYAGTSYSVAGQTSEKRIYDEMLAVGYNRIGLPITTASRVAQYEELARSIHTACKDIIYTGGCQLDGLKYDFCRLNRCVNVAAVDMDGDVITTGWEAVHMILTDVEYNFAEQTTSLTFSQEALTAMGDEIDLLKQRLRIGYVQTIRVMNAYLTFSQDRSKYSNKPEKYTYASGVVYSDYDLYYDPNLGKVDNALGGPQYDTTNLSSNIATDVGVITPEDYDPYSNPIGAFNPALPIPQNYPSNPASGGFDPFGVGAGGA